MFECAYTNSTGHIVNIDCSHTGCCFENAPCIQTACKCRYESRKWPGTRRPTSSPSNSPTSYVYIATFTGLSILFVLIVFLIILNRKYKFANKLISKLANKCCCCDSVKNSILRRVSTSTNFSSTIPTRSTHTPPYANRLNFFFIDSTNSHQQSEQLQQQQQQEQDLPRYEDIIQPANNQNSNSNQDQHNSSNPDVDLNTRQSEPPSYDEFQRFQYTK